MSFQLIRKLVSRTQPPPSERYASTHPECFKWDILLDDISGSMEEEGFEPGRNKLDLACDSSLGFLHAKRAAFPDSCLAVLHYSTDCDIGCSFLNVQRDFGMIEDAIRKMHSLPHGATQIYTGLERVTQLLTDLRVERGPIPGHQVRVIASSDGHDGKTKLGLRKADHLKKQGVLIETVGVGRNRASVDESFLKALCTTDESGVHYRFLGDAQSVRSTFTKLATGTLTFEG